MCLYLYFTKRPPPNPNNYVDPFNALVEEQNFIGWDNFFRGKFLVSWNEIQRAYIKSSLLRNPKSPLKKHKQKNVVITMYTTIFNVIYDL